MRFSIRYLLALVISTVLVSQASAQLDDFRRRVREAREAVREVSGTVDDVGSAVKEVSGAVEEIGATATKVIDSVTPDPTPQGLAEQAKRFAAECEARAAAACVSMCTTVSQGINPQTSLPDAQAIMQLCTNAHAAAVNPPPAAAAVPPAAAPLALPAPPPAAAPSGAAREALIAPYLKELARLRPGCDALPIEKGRVYCQMYCTSVADVIRTDTLRPLDEVGKEAVQNCARAVEGIDLTALSAPPPPTPEQAARNQQREEDRRRAQQVQLEVQASTAESYAQKRKECEGLAADNPYKNACVAACGQAEANEAVGMFCVVQHDNAL